MSINDNKKGNIVILSNIEWFFLKQRHQYLAEQLYGLGYNVIFVESAAKRNPTLSDIPRIIARLGKFLSRNTHSNKSGISVVTPIVLPSTAKLNRWINNMIFVRFLSRSILRKLDIGVKTTIVFYAPTSTNLQLIKLIKAENTIYDCVSNFEAFKEMPSDTLLIEDALIKLADHTVVDCDFLYKKHRGKGKSIIVQGPAVDFDKFNLLPKISKQLKKSIQHIVYFGQVEPLKIDIELLNYISNSGISVSIVGDIRSTDLSSNIITTPSIDSDKLPEFISQYDAIILPYRVNEYTNGIIPAKFFECFATGLPIIATLPYNFKPFKNLLITGETKEDLVSKIRTFNYNDDTHNRVERQRIAKENSWESFAMEFEKLL